MGVSDHAIESLRTWYDLAYEELKEEYTSSKYKKLSECPSYKETAAYREAMNVLIKGCYLPEYVDSHLVPPLKRSLDEEIGIENFWKEQEKEKL